jgi:hypothetical protein
MAKTHWKKLTNPDYLGAYALQPGEEKILTIRSVSNEMVVGTDGKKEECQVAHFMGQEKPMILNKTNMKTIEKVYKTPYVEDWAGKKIAVYTEKVKAFGEIVEALRIRNKIPQEERPVSCEKCGKAIQAAHGLSAWQLAEYTHKKYGAKVCAQCAMNLAEEQADGETNVTKPEGGTE